MAKIGKQMYYDAKGNKKINCYKVNLSKEIVNKSKIDINKDIEIIAEDKKITIKEK